MTTDFKLRDKCPSCAAETRELLREPLSTGQVGRYLSKYYQGRADLNRMLGTDYDVHECPGCGLIYQRRVPDGQLLSDLYDRWIPQTECKRMRADFGFEDYHYISGQVEYLQRYFGRAHLDVLDFGCGWCEWAGLAQAHGCTVAGAELSQERIAHARSIGIEIIDWDEIPKRRFDYINTEQVFEHLIDPRLVIEHLSKALKPGGLLKISVPDGRGARKTLLDFGAASAKQIMPIAPLEHVNCFDHRSLVKLGEQVGLRPVVPSLVKLLRVAPELRTLARWIYRYVFPRSTFVYFTT